MARRLLCSSTLRPTGALLLALMAFLLLGCERNPPITVREGPAFAAAEAVPAGSVLVYFYWPREESGPWEEIRLISQEGGSELARRGGYTVMALTPGSKRFEALRLWELSSLSTASIQLGEVEMETRVGEVYFVRLGQRRSALFTVEMRPIEAAAALREIRKCRRTLWSFEAAQPGPGADPEGAGA